MHTPADIFFYIEQRSVKGRSQYPLFSGEVGIPAAQSQTVRGSDSGRADQPYGMVKLFNHLGKDKILLNIFLAKDSDIWLYDVRSEEHTPELNSSHVAISYAVF